MVFLQIYGTWVMEVFQESVVVFFRQNKYTIIRKFWAIFYENTRGFKLQKSQKNTVLSAMATTYI